MFNSATDESLYDDERYVPAAGIVRDADHFDADFFSFSAREAECIQYI